MAKYTVGITGASGVVYGTRLIEVLLDLGHCLDVVITSAGEKVLKDELNLTLKGSTTEKQKQLLDHVYKSEVQLTLHDIQDIGAVIASGSYKNDGMIIAPCTMGSLASIAAGLSSNLLERAADVTIKEGRKLIIVPRETPLSAIHLGNMLKLSQLGVRIVPPVPAFYNHPKGLNDVINFVAGKVLDQLDIKHSLFPRWEQILNKES